MTLAQVPSLLETVRVPFESTATAGVTKNNPCYAAHPVDVKQVPSVEVDVKNEVTESTSTTGQVVEIDCDERL